MLEDFAAVPGHEGLHEIAVGNHHAGGEHHVGHVVQVTPGDEAFEFVEAPNGDDDIENHGKSGIDGSGHEVRREDGRMPSGDDGHGKVKANDAMNGEDQRRGETGEKQVGGLVALPMRRGAAPAEREHAVDNLPAAGGRAVPQGGEVWNEADVPKDQRDQEVSADRENVPDQGTAELRPEVHGVRIREEPVKNPRAAEMEQREEPGAGHCEQGHGLRETVDGCAPFLQEEEENCRNESARMADPDPPDEIDDGKAPGDGNVHPPDADSTNEQISHREEEQHDETERERETGPPGLGLHAGQHDRANGLGD